MSTNTMTETTTDDTWTSPTQKIHNPLHQALPLIFCAAGICSCYLYYGVLQEQVFFNDYRVDASFILVSQTATNVLVALIWERISSALLGSKKKEEGSLRHGLLLLTAFCYFVAMTASNECLHYVSYPTAVLAKSCKLIPTMAMGYFVEKRNYEKGEWIGAGCITCGIVLFNISRQSQQQQQKGDESGGDSLFGLALLGLSLFMDGLLGACQGLLKQQPQPQSDKSTRQYRPPNATETMLFVNLYALLFLFPLSYVTGQWSHGVHLLRQHSSLSKGMSLLNATASMGQIFIFLTIHWFSPLVCTTITTTRKFFTILLSVLRFGHVFSTIQWCSVVLVFGGLYSVIVSKSIKPTKQKVE